MKKNDERFKWILVSNEDDINDGVLVEDKQYERFLKEANPMKFDIVKE